MCNVHQSINGHLPRNARNSLMSSSGGLLGTYLSSIAFISLRDMLLKYCVSFSATLNPSSQCTEREPGWLGAVLFGAVEVDSLLLEGLPAFFVFPGGTCGQS
jgi:hypothetical protein